MSIIAESDLIGNFAQIPGAFRNAREYWQLIRQRAYVNTDMDATIAATEMNKKAKNPFLACYCGPTNRKVSNQTIVISDAVSPAGRNDGCVLKFKQFIKTRYCPIIFELNKMGMTNHINHRHRPAGETAFAACSN